MAEDRRALARAAQEIARRAIPAPIRLANAYLNQANADPRRITPFGDSDSFRVINDHSLEHLDRIANLVQTNHFLLGVLSSFEYTGTSLKPSPSINGSMSVAFFSTMLNFFENGYSNYFFGYYEKMVTVSVYELTFLSRITHLNFSHGYGLMDYIDDIRQINRLINRNIEFYSDVTNYFLRLPGGGYLYVDRLEAHSYPLDIILDQEIALPVREMRLFDENIIPNKLLTKIFDWE